MRDPNSRQELAAKTIGRTELLYAGGMLAAAGIVELDVWRDTLKIATSDEECSYVLVAPFVIGWLVWVRHRKLLGCPVQGQWAGLSLLVSGWLISWHGYVTDPVLWRAGAALIALGAVVAAVGLKASLKLAPALAALVFLIPIDPTGRYHVAEPLGRATAFAAKWTCDCIGMSVDRSGNLLSINGIDVTIAEACNGLRMVLTLFMVCYLVAFSFPFKTCWRLLLLAATPLMAIVANVIRLIPTIWMFGHTSESRAEQFHSASGWAMTVIAFAVLMSGALLLQDRALPSPNPDVLPPGSIDTKKGRRDMISSGAYRFVAIIFLAAIAIHRYAIDHGSGGVERYRAEIREAAVRIPRHFGSWVGEEVPVPVQAMAVLKPNVLISRRYTNIETGVVAGLMLVHCGNAHHMAGHFPLRCYPAVGWELRSSAHRDWSAAGLRIGGSEYQFHLDSLAGRGEQSIVVINCLLCANGRVLRDMDGMNKAIAGASGAASGAGQVQVYFDASVPQPQRDAAVEAILGGCKPILTAILASLKQ